MLSLFVIRVLHDFAGRLLKPSEGLLSLKHLLLELFQLLLEHKVVVFDHPLPERVLLNAGLQLDPLLFEPEVGFSQLVQLLTSLQVSFLHGSNLVV